MSVLPATLHSSIDQLLAFSSSNDSSKMAIESQIAEIRLYDRLRAQETVVAGGAGPGKIVEDLHLRLAGLGNVHLSAIRSA